MSSNENEIIMFISDNDQPVYQSEFERLVNKHRTKGDIEFYVRSISQYTNNFFEPSTNIEIVTIQNMIWNGVIKTDLEERCEQLYFDAYIYTVDIKNIIRKEYNDSPDQFYKKLVQTQARTLNLKYHMKQHLKKMELEFPSYNYGFSQTFFRLSNMYYKLKDVIWIISMELKSATITYHKYRKDMLVSTTLCFKHNFGLDFNLQIDERSFIDQIQSYLF